MHEDAIDEGKSFVPGTMAFDVHKHNILLYSMFSHIKISTMKTNANR